MVESAGKRGEDAVRFSGLPSNRSHTIDTQCFDVRFLDRICDSFAG